MAGKKKEGLSSLKEVSGGKWRDDRNASEKTHFDPISIDAKNALTVIYLLQSPEDNVMLRAVASLEGFGRKDAENLKFLCSLGISKYLFPLISSKDSIVKRFTFKLIGMLSKFEEFREELFQRENVLETFNSVLKSDPDVLLQEFSSLTLSNMSTDYSVASDLLKVEGCIETLFIRITSLDPDVEKNCLEIMNHLLNDVNGIEAFIESSGFQMQPLINLISSSYPVIQALALEVLMQLTSWCRDPRVLYAFRDASGISQILTVLEKEEWSDLHLGTIELLLNITDNPEMCDYLYRSGCLLRFVSLLDSTPKTSLLEKMVGVLARMSQSVKARSALHSVEIEKRFIGYLEEPSEYIQEASCLGLANQCQYFPSLDSILSENPIKSLMDIIINSEKNSNLRNMAAYTLNILCNFDERLSEILLQSEELFGRLLSILTDSDHLPTEMSQNVIQVLMGISSSQRLRSLAVSEQLFKALISCLPNNTDLKKDVSLQVDALECISEFLIESEARALFNYLDGVDITLNCLRSKFASVREWAGHLVVIASQGQDFVKAFVRKNGLQWMLKEKNTMYSMPSWQSAIESIFSNFLPAKFAFTGRLDFQDITQDGFYILTQPNAPFVELEFFFEQRVSPIIPIYVASFNTPIECPEEVRTKSTTASLIYQTMEPQNLNKYMKGADRNSQEEYVWPGSINTYPSVDYKQTKTEPESSTRLEQFFPDTFLSEHLQDLMKRIAKEESCIDDSSWLSIYQKLICKRAKIIAEFVADEMSGPEPNPICSAQYKITQINEIKHFLGSNIIPLGLIRMGDYLERAMLFKVLADRIGFPCALVRGPYGRAWIEIAVPVINVEETLTEESRKEKVNSLSINSESNPSSEAAATNGSGKSFSRNSSQTKSTEGVSENDFWFPNLKIQNFKGFPNCYLKPNAVVDLVNNPGQILNINSYETKEYCGNFIFPKVDEKVKKCELLTDNFSSVL